MSRRPHGSLVSKPLAAVRTRHDPRLADLMEMNEGLVGVSTGFIRELRGDWSEIVAAAANFSQTVIELSALSAPEVPGLVAFLNQKASLPFARVLVHGPAKRLPDHPEQLLAALIEALPAYVEGVVVHPETLQEPAELNYLGDRVILENMDRRKPDARTVSELERIFDVLPSARFCLDVAHAQLNDPTLALAHALLDGFESRLAEVHVSSILPSGRHVPLAKDDLVQLEPVLARCGGVPWILEA